MVLATFAGTVAAISLKAPNLLVPMWTLLFGSLGWNFLEYAITWPGGVDPGWLICGIVFELMALPGLIVILVSRGSMWTTGKGAEQQTHGVRPVVGHLSRARHGRRRAGCLVLLLVALTCPVA